MKAKDRKNQIYDVYVYRPQKNNGLKFIKKIDCEELSESYWIQARKAFAESRSKKVLFGSYMEYD